MDEDSPTVQAAQQQYDQEIFQLLQEAEEMLQQVNQQIADIQTANVHNDETVQSQVDQLCTLQEMFQQQFLQISQLISNNTLSTQQNVQAFMKIEQMMQSIMKQIYPEQNISRRHNNRICHELGLLLPIINEQNGEIPLNFPATKGDLVTIKKTTLNELLSFYNLPISENFKENHLRFSQFIGVD